MNSWKTQLGLCIGGVLLTCTGALAQVCGSSTNDCCVSSAVNKGCADATCCSTVCAVDPYCCSTNWDNICATEAHSMCLVCMSCGTSPNVCCAASTAGFPFCSDAPCCALICGIDPYCCNTNWDGICGNEATAHCTGCGATPACGSSYNNCCDTSPNSTPYCSNAPCCGTVCALDPFCCNVRWDSICASEAHTYCTVCPLPCPADLNGDGSVDGADLGMLLGNWGHAGVGDLDHNGNVDGADLGALLGAWGPCSPPAE